jgi:hypothetical protein
MKKDRAATARNAWATNVVASAAMCMPSTPNLHAS